MGPNFLNFGIVEHPVSVVDFRLKFTPWSHDRVIAFEPQLPCERRWTDGSVVLQESFWLTTGALAVVDQHENCVASGRVNHASYAAELIRTVCRFSCLRLPQPASDFH